MTKPIQLAAVAASALLVLGAVTPASAAPSPAPSSASLSNALYTPGGPPLLEPVQYFYGGRRYCWYFDGWRGPGYYWCGYGARRGFGWGGPRGWHGWRDHRPYYYHGGHYRHDYHRGGYRHGGYRHGGHRDGGHHRH